MNIETLAGIMIYGYDHHTGARSRLYRLASRIGSRLRLPDSAWREISSPIDSDEWSEAQAVYRALVARDAK